jgi:hypothetical protein
MELQLLRNVVRAQENYYKAARAAYSIHNNTNPILLNAENVYFRRVGRAGFRPWTLAASKNVNNARRNLNNARQKIRNNSNAAAARRNQALTAARVVFGPNWSVANSIALLRIGRSRGKNVLRKYIIKKRVPIAEHRRYVRNHIAHNLKFYRLGNNGETNSNNITITPSKMGRKTYGVQ